ncbi:RNA polymerase factor sigma-32 [Azospirillum tabaci]|uniref:RNA polymerase factor sigma-32 n=1 Tax=Azospirillum tabaci TaxID=2752310 RepID=UPI001660BFD9|nr:RNA polymerase factor sigma-32 [Azospirillum tabaci]
MKEHERSAEPLTLYLQDLRKYDYLSPEDEQDLARRWRDEGDAGALDKLVGSHLRLAVKVAKDHRRYGLPLADLVAEGNMGLMHAARKFDPDKGYRFSTYAFWWIRAAIQEYVLHNWSMVKIGKTTAQRTLFFNLRRMKARMRELDNGDLSPEAAKAIASELGLPENDVVEMNRRLSVDRSLNAPLSSDGETEWQDLLADERANQEVHLAELEERNRQRQLIKLGLQKLNDRDRQILIARRLLDTPVPADELSRRFNLSRQRIGQIEAKAFKTVQKAIVANRAERRLNASPNEKRVPLRVGGPHRRESAGGR